jgi:hypothetical protein
MSAHLRERLDNRPLLLPAGTTNAPIKIDTADLELFKVSMLSLSA